MAWEKIDIGIDGATIKGNIDGNMIEIPFIKTFSDESVVSIGEKTKKVINITNVGNRNEILQLEVEDDKQVQRRTKGKTKQD
tara:strand:+ start:3795 stop:4040 length:246 start_codon:yes stop_codon:yes gene_type:complete